MEDTDSLCAILTTSGSNYKYTLNSFQKDSIFVFLQWHCPISYLLYTYKRNFDRELGL